MRPGLVQEANDTYLKNTTGEERKEKVLYKYNFLSILCASIFFVFPLEEISPL